jgi:hypothetical protein
MKLPIERDLRQPKKIETPLVWLQLSDEAQNGVARNRGFGEFFVLIILSVVS